MSTLMELTIVLLVCPAALAAWVDARYPSMGVVVEVLERAR